MTMEVNGAQVMSETIGFIGGGAMAEALISGLINTNLARPGHIYVYDVDTRRAQYIENQYHINIAVDMPQLIANANIIILAVKPWVVSTVLAQAKSYVTESHLIISIAAGVTTSALEKQLAADVPVVRAMPNTPALVGSAATALCCGRWAESFHLEQAKDLFNAVGLAVALDESLMDAVTGLSGSGPAYMYVVVEALADAGVRSGLPRQAAQILAAQTMLGAARMVLETKQHPGVLKDMVTTPGGTTIEGLFALEEGGLRTALAKAVERACTKSKELSGAD